MSAKNSYHVQQLVLKMKNPDFDLRFMALTDLISEIQRSGDHFGVDEGTEHATVEQVLLLMNDTNGEVKNLAVKTLATLVKHISEARIQTILERLVALTASKDESARDIASLGLKSVVAEIPPGSQLATTACTKLAPKVISQLDMPASSSELLIDSLDLLSDIFSRFESTIRTLPILQNSVLKHVVPMLTNPRAAVRKRAVGTLATLIASSDLALFEVLLTNTVIKDLKSKDIEKKRTAVSLVGAFSRNAPSKMERKAADLLPLVLTASRDEDDELREGALQTLELLVFKCPTHTSPFISQILDIATRSIKYDPNYALGSEDGDVEMGNQSDEDEVADDEDDDFGDEYSDDDDQSWKVRRAATKLISACIVTRSDLLTLFYKVVSPVLIARFSEREETVQVEIWDTFTTLLVQTKVWGSSTQAREAEANLNGRLKRKRSVREMEIEDGPITLLHLQTSTIAKSILKQLGTKSFTTRKSGFRLLRALVAVLDGGLEGQVPLLVGRIDTALKASDSGLSGAATALKLEVLSFLALFFENHHAKTFSDELSKVMPLLVLAIGDKFNKIAVEAFVAATELVRVLRPILPSPAPVSTAVTSQILAIYEATMKRLSSSDADEEVKGKGIKCLGTILFHFGDHLGDKFDASLDFLQDRLNNEVSRLVTVKVVGEVAQSPVCGGPKFDVWAQECLLAVSSLLRKVHRPLKIAAFDTVKALIDRSGSGLATDTSRTLITNIQPLITDIDTNLLPLALYTLASLLQSAKDEVVAEIETSILPRTLDLVNSPLVQGPSLDGLLDFLAAYVRAGAEPLSILQVLAKMAEAAGKTVDVNSSQGGILTLATSSRCIGVIVREAPDVAKEIINQYAARIKTEKGSVASLILALLTLGEIGRVVDFEKFGDVFDQVINHFSATSEDVRRSAAFSAGNIAVGNIDTFLPAVLQLIQTDDRKRYLALQALKEIIHHSTLETLARISDRLWTPLFDNCQAQEEGTRNVAADCLGQLTVTNPAKFLPQLQARLSADSRHTRATVIAAIRFTFTNDSTAYDELLAPLIAEFFKLMHDPDLGVRRLALSSLNSAAHNKPHLVREHLSTLLPELYSQTEIDPSLVRIVEMGPFKHKVDDGLDVRKTAYECMHTLLDTCLKEIEIHEYLRRVLVGLSDEEEVKKLCYLMLVKLSEIAPAAVTQKLDDAVPPFTDTLQASLKESAVKQETEKLAELQKAALRCMVALNRRASPDITPKFINLINTVVLQGKLAADYKELSQLSNLQQSGRLGMS